MALSANSLTAHVAAVSAAVAFVVGYALAVIPTPCWLAPPADLPAPAHPPPAKAAALDGWRVRSVRPTASGHEAELVGPNGETWRVPADNPGARRAGPPRDPLLYGP